jgi:hypothetical protein
LKDPKAIEISIKDIMKTYRSKVVNEIIQANKVADPNAITRLNDI